MRGTVNIEAAMAFCRNGMWHFFCNSGPGTFHAVSNRPDRFCGILADEQGPGRDSPGHESPGHESPWRDRTLLESYYLGPFHAARVFQDPLTLAWYMTSTRKEEQRRLNRVAGRDVFRGSLADESVLTEGMYICRIEWHGDQPIPARISDDVPSGLRGAGA
jgi:hypothetical protein